MGIIEKTTPLFKKRYKGLTLPLKLVKEEERYYLKYTVNELLTSLVKYNSSYKVITETTHTSESIELKLELKHKELEEVYNILFHIFVCYGYTTADLDLQLSKYLKEMGLEYSEYHNNTTIENKITRVANSFLNLRGLLPLSGPIRYTYLENKASYISVELVAFTNTLLVSIFEIMLVGIAFHQNKQLENLTTVLIYLECIRMITGSTSLGNTENTD